MSSRVAQWKRAGPITQRSVDRNHVLLKHFFLCFCSIFLFHIGRHTSQSLCMVISWKPCQTWLSPVFAALAPGLQECTTKKRPEYWLSPSPHRPIVSWWQWVPSACLTMLFKYFLLWLDVSPSEYVLGVCSLGVVADIHSKFFYQQALILLSAGFTFCLAWCCLSILTGVQLCKETCLDQYQLNIPYVGVQKQPWPR